jgi:hypothetical protein
MRRTTLRYRSGLVLGSLVIGAAAVGAGGRSLAAEPDPAAACASLAALGNFPVTPTQITLAKYNPQMASSTMHRRAGQNSIR